jgi:pimeloyl-ACP methyl ester carboxylesterase
VTTFVLVHGWWLGGWSWDRVAARLEADGHDVVTPALLGCGERALELRPELDLDRQATDLAAALRVLKIQEAVVVGHDYGAMVASSALTLAPACGRALILLDGLVADEGQSVLDLLPSLRPWFADLAARVGSRWRIPPPSAQALGIDANEDVAWARARMTSIAWHTQDSPLSRSAPSVPRAYIRCTSWPHAGRMALAAQLSGWPVIDVDAGHAAMITHPDQVAAALQRLAGSPTRVVDLRDREAVGEHPRRLRMPPGPPRGPAVGWRRHRPFS